MSNGLAALVTQIRNGCAIGRQFVDLPLSRVNRRVCEVLVQEGFAWDLGVCDSRSDRFRLFLKYGKVGERVLSHIRCESKSGRRVYRGLTGMKPSADGFGVLIVSTPRGIVSHFEALRLGVGGEVLVQVW